MANEGLPWLGEDKVLCALLSSSFCPCGGCTGKDLPTGQCHKHAYVPGAFGNIGGELLVIMVLHCARAGEGSWGWRGVNTEQVLIKCQECSRRNEKKEIYGRRRTLLIALVKCKCVGRKRDVYWQGQKSSQNRCILVMRVRTLCRAISFPQDTPA